ncbi:hypothetical protein BD324DRAFT_649940 [Kockovaella imperatae]|uniref:Uncharacterized protein n=1 Tax=Kockovaella imperatae TaxID=4999 RepID=A0A1Y1UKJ0_9TREE|nr:hypothetical protein BD324DRAFT_649940 [Kockovaella imperatae]ORX38580.1 hypothetical protein BD324DRAFT_649940 [Kockovaella imperatae]
MSIATHTSPLPPEHLTILVEYGSTARGTNVCDLNPELDDCRHLSGQQLKELEEWCSGRKEEINRQTSQLAIKYAGEHINDFIYSEDEVTIRRGTSTSTVRLAPRLVSVGHANDIATDQLRKDDPNTLCYGVLSADVNRRTGHDFYVFPVRGQHNDTDADVKGFSSICATILKSCQSGCSQEGTNGWRFCKKSIDDLGQALTASGDPVRLHPFRIDAPEVKWTALKETAGGGTAAFGQFELPTESEYQWVTQKLGGRTEFVPNQTGSTTEILSSITAQIR